jgi:uncharacterized membrane protein YgcG
VAGRSRRIARTVDHAEERTGLQFCVYLGPAGQDDAHARALSLFQQAKPDVLLLVAPDQHRVEIVTAENVRDRVSDAACEHAIAVMRPLLRRADYEWAIVAGVEDLAQVAGRGRAAPDAVELPDLIDESQN